MRSDLALAATGTGSFEWDPAGGRLEWDDRTRRLFDLPPGVLHGQAGTLLARVHPDDAPGVDEAVRAAAGRGDSCLLHFRIARPDRTVRRLRLHGRALPGPDGVGRVVGIVRDVTEDHELVSWLQQVMLPRRMPRIPGLSVAARYVSGTRSLEIGGDWYDVVPLPGGHVGLVIGDVQGHNAHAAAVMGQLRAALRAYATEGHDPPAVAARSSRFLADLDTGLFATCTYVDLDTVTGTAEIVRAGHLGPLVRGPFGDSVWTAADGGLPLGIDPDSGYPVTRLELEPGSVLLLCTDGAVESRSRDVDSGAARLRDCLTEGSAEAVDELADDLAAVAREQRNGPDDLAMLVVRWDAPADHLLRRRLRRAVDPADLVAVGRVRRQLRSALGRWGVPELADTAELLASELVTNALVHTDHGAVLTATLTTDADPGRAEEEDTGGAGRTPGAARGLDGPPDPGPGGAEPAGAARHTVLTVPGRPGPPRGTRLRVEIHDRASQRPRSRTPGEQATSGRGLLLVRALADEWGVLPRGEGKVTWFELVCP